MQHIAANRHNEAFKPTLAPPDSQRIQQRLGRVFVTAIASIDNSTSDMLCQQFHSTAILMANHQHIRAHGVQRHRGIDQRFAFFDRRSLHRHIDHIRTKPFASKLEGCAGAGGILKKQIDLGKAAQLGELFVGAPVQLDIAVGTIQQIADLKGLKPFNAKKMFLR